MDAHYSLDIISLKHVLFVSFHLTLQGQANVMLIFELWIHLFKGVLFTTTWKFVFHLK